VELTRVTEAAETAGWPRRPPVPADVARSLLRDADLELLGRMPWSSNGTYLASLGDERGELLAIYKPRQGERPLWDFRTGTLCQREVAAFAVSEAIGWEIVPDTVLRDGPLGVGSVQRFVDHDPEEHYFTLLPDHVDELRRFGAFDIVVNNTDRKGGHCLLGEDGHVWGIDHGVTFHEHWKLRTVIWDFAGEKLDAVERAGLACLVHAFDGALTAELAELLSPAEIAAAQARAEHLLERGRFPVADDDYRNFPWPLV
jgi:uncharacterized repeat protein (TIGR03843 family)